MAERFDPEEIKRRLKFLDLCAHEGIALRRSGGNFVGRCPFHEEGTGSFTVHSPEFDHGHCYGCGWNGDIFDLWCARHGGTFVESLAPLASLASVSPSTFEAKRRRLGAVPQVTGKRSNAVREKPELPRLRALEGGEFGDLARLRKLSIEGITAAACDKRVGACTWPQWQDQRGYWHVADGAAPSWVVTDHSRRVAQFRRLDGGKFVRKDGKEIKAWTKGSPTWPLGAAEIGSRLAVLLVEGGADMLAAYHFLVKFERLHAVAVCAMLGASIRIAEDALPYFRRKRVRIVMDQDEAGCEAAARWTEQLCGVGAAVETFTLAGLVKKDLTTKVKDLNDLAEVDEAAWLDPELRAMFFDFNF